MSGRSAPRKKIMPRLLSAVALVAVAGGVGWALNDGAVPNLPGPQPVSAPDPAPPGEVQDANCPDIQVMEIPGTWESADGDDPYNPTAFPQGLLRGVIGPLAQSYSPDRARFFTLPYPAQFRNPQRADQFTYDQSRDMGTQKLRRELTALHTACPYTRVAIIGFSQGAVIAGDVTSQIGTSNQPIPQHLLVGSVLVADGRRQQDAGRIPGDVVLSGHGAELSLQPLSALTQLANGSSMMGPRPGGFGAVNDRTWQICAPTDLICNAPLSITDGITNMGKYMADQVVHAQYATNPDVVPGTTATAWASSYLRTLIDNAPVIAHPG